MLGDALILGPVERTFTVITVNHSIRPGPEHDNFQFYFLPKIFRAFSGIERNVGSRKRTFPTEISTRTQFSTKLS